MSATEAVEFLCDFCERPMRDPKTQGWTYPCADFNYSFGIEERGTGPLQRVAGGWLACEACGGVVESGNPRLLAQHVAGSKLVLRAAKRKYDAVVKHLVGMYEAFFKARSGPRRRPDFGDEFEARLANAGLPDRCHLGTRATPCPEKAGCEVRVTDDISAALRIEWLPACLPCARRHLQLAVDARVMLDDIKARKLSGVAPKIPRRIRS